MKEFDPDCIKIPGKLTEIECHVNVVFDYSKKLGPPDRNRKQIPVKLLIIIRLMMWLQAVRGKDKWVDEEKNQYEKQWGSDNCTLMRKADLRIW